MHRVSFVRPRRKLHAVPLEGPPDSQHAVVLVGKKITRVRSVALAEPGDHEVRVKLQGCGISAWHVPIWEGCPDYRYPQEAGAPGHEGWGFVDAVGAGIRDLEVGQRVAIMSGHSYAEYDIAARDRVVPLPEELDDEPFPGEAFGEAMHLFERSDIHRGHTVAIVGAGFMGLLLTQLAADRGAHVVALSHRGFELECADRMDAEETVLVHGDGHDAERALCTNGGKPFDRVIEVVGTPAARALAKRICAEHACPVSAGDGQTSGDARARYVSGVRKAIQAALEGRLDPFPLMSHSVPMRSVDRGFELTRECPEGFVKALLVNEN